MIKNKKYIVFILFLLSIFISCGKTEEIKEENKMQIIRTVMPKINYNLNVHEYKNNFDRALIIQIFEGLTEIKDERARLVSVKSIKHSDDFKTWTFFLRDDMFWSDGKKIDASTYKNSWLKALENKNVSDEVYRFFVIDGAKEYFKKKISKEKVGIKIDEKNNALIVELNKEIKNFDEWVSNPIFYPIREENNKITDFKNLIVNGAFKITNIENDKILLAKNEKYWDAINTRLKNVEIYLMEDSIMAYEMFPRMEIDIFGLPFYDIPYERREQFNSLPSKLTFNTSKYSYITIDENILFNNEVIRQQMYNVSDPEFVANVILQDGSTSIFPHPHPTSDVTNIASEKFIKIKDKMNFSFPEQGFTAYNRNGIVIDNKVLISTIKEWVTFFKIPIRVKNEMKNRATFEFESYLVGTNNIEDFYYYLNNKFNLKNKISNTEDFFKYLPVIPVNKINSAILVYPYVNGLFISNNGDLHLKYIYIR